MKLLANRLKFYFKIYLCCIRFNLSDLLIYRLNALLIGVAPIIWLGTMIIFTQLIYSQVDQLGGWSFWEVIFLTAVHEILFILTWGTFAYNFSLFSRDVRTGKFDQALLKPVNPRFIVSFRWTDFTIVLSFINAVVVFIISITHISILPSFVRILGFLLLMFLAYLIAYFVHFILASLNLFFISVRHSGEWIQELEEFGRYPAEIYSSWFKNLLTFFVPILFFSYIPTAFFLGKIGSIYIFFGFGLSIILYFISKHIWHSGLKHYQSASS